MRSPFEIVLAAPRDRLIEESKIAGSFDIVAERLERPDDNVPGQLLALNGGVGFEHEPLRPVAAVRILLGEYYAQDFLHRLVMLERQQQFDRALANIARAPSAAGILLEPTRGGEMDHTVVREPGKDRIDGERIDGILGALHADPARKIPPEAVGGLEHLNFVDGPGVFLGQCARLLRIGHRSDNRKSEFLRRARPDRDVRAASAMSVHVEQFVAADRLDAPRRARHQMIDGQRVFLTPNMVGVRPESEPLAARVDLGPAGVREFPLT